MIRLFVALHIPSEVRSRIFSLIEEIIPDYQNYKWEKFEKVHLTLKFIGHIDEKYLEQIKINLSFIENYHKFQFKVTDFNFFFRHNNPQILWIGLGTSDPIKKLVKEIENSLIPFSVPLEKRGYKAHLTLLRLKDNPGQDFIDAFKNFKVPEIDFISDEIILMQSLLKQTGSEYKELKVYKLK